MFYTIFAIYVFLIIILYNRIKCKAVKGRRRFLFIRISTCLTANEFICLQHYMEIYIIYTAGGINHYASFVTYIVSIVRNRVNEMRL